MPKRTKKRPGIIPEWLVNSGFILGWGLAIGLGVLYFQNNRPLEQPAAAIDEPAPAPDMRGHTTRSVSFAPRYAELERTLIEISEQNGMAGSTVVSCILDGAGEVVFSFNGERSFVPASALKTVTTATVLEKSGPDYRFRTLLQGTAPFPEPDSPPTDGVYQGDLVIVGGGDPSLATEDLIAWATELTAMGIEKVDGRIIGDGSVFPELIAAKAWDWGDVGNYYGAPAAGLNIDRNTYVATFRPGASIGDLAVLMEMIPEVAGVTTFNRMFTSEQAGHGRDAPYAYSGPYSTTITFRGAVPITANEEVIAGAVPDPVFSASSRLHRILKQRGVAVSGEPTTSRLLEIEGNTPPVPEMLQPGISHTSEPLIDLIKHTHKVSDNLFAECFFRLLALEQENGSGQTAIMSHWAGRDLRLKGLRMEDGSGLARADLIRAVDLAKVNFLARHGPHGQAFFETLTPQFDGQMRWKGGAMSRVRAYVGFIAATAEELTFVLAFNNYDADSVSVTKARERFLKVLTGL